MSLDQARSGVTDLRSALERAGRELNGTIARGWIKPDIREQTLKDLRKCYEALNRALEKIGKPTSQTGF